MSKHQEMSIHDFRDELKKDVEKFYGYWLQNQILNSEHFPTNLPPGDWFEQFLAYINFNTKP